MKKLTWIAALLMALALIVTGCGDGNSGDPDDDDEEDTRGVELDGTEQFWLATSDTGMRKWPNNVMKLESEDAEGTGYVRIFFQPPGGIPANTATLAITFSITVPHDIMWQCAWDKNGKWGRSGNDDNYADNTDGYNGPISCRPRVVFNGGGMWGVAEVGDWGITEPGNENAANIDLASLRGVCLQLPYAEGTFTLTDVTFTTP